jgi:histidinol-phosphate aminotransferase
MSKSQSAALVRNRYFDELAATPGLYWLGQNTNHIESHPAVREAMLRSIEQGEFNAYAPPLGFEALRSAIIVDLGVQGVEALVTEGGVNALAMICRARCKSGTTLVTTDPTWKWPCLFARQQGAEVIEIPIYDPACNHRLTAEALKAHVDERTAIIYLVDPNNPLGIRYTREEIEQFAAIARDRGALLVHDCTYRDFADSHTPAPHVAPEGSVVSMSFSKWLGLAGLRIGALVASRGLFEEFAQASTSVLGASVIAQRAAQAGLTVKAEWMQKSPRHRSRQQGDDPRGDHLHRGVHASDLPLARQFPGSGDGGSRHPSRGAGRVLSAAGHHDPPGHLSHRTFWRSICKGLHLGSFAMGRKVLHAVAADGGTGAHAQRPAAAILNEAPDDPYKDPRWREPPCGRSGRGHADPLHP